VELVPWGPDDRALLGALLGDPAMMGHLGGPETDEKLDERQARFQQPASGQYKIVEDAVGAGSVGYWERDWLDETVWELGWFVLPAFQGRGLAARATAAVIEIARGDEPGRPFHAFPAVDNPPSNAICRKLGFTLLGALDFEYPPGNRLRCNDWRLP
jgi:RimJ/RimL family protein N-acetyltransferase